MGCKGKCEDSNGARHVYSCYYGTEWIEGEHEEHDWSSAIYNRYVHCYGSTSSGGR